MHSFAAEINALQLCTIIDLFQTINNGASFYCHLANICTDPRVCMKEFNGHIKLDAELAVPADLHTRITLAYCQLLLLAIAI